MKNKKQLSGTSPIKRKAGRPVGSKNKKRRNKLDLITPNSSIDEVVNKLMEAKSENDRIKIGQDAGLFPTEAEMASLRKETKNITDGLCELFKMVITMLNTKK